MQPGVVPGAVLELHAAKALSGLSPQVNSPLGVAWQDTSGNGNHGTLTGFAGETPWAGTGTPAGPYRCAFDGVNDYVAFPDLGACEDKNFTYEVLIQTNIMPASHGALISEGEQATAVNRSFLYISTPTGQLAYLAYDSAGAALCAMAPSWVSVCNGTVHHAILAANATTARLYLDNVLISGPTAIGAGSIATNSTVVGARRISGVVTAYFPGAILTARIYPFALTPAQVAQNYNAGPLWAPAVSGFPVIGSPILQGVRV